MGRNGIGRRANCGKTARPHLWSPGCNCEADRASFLEIDLGPLPALVVMPLAGNDPRYEGFRCENC